MEETNVTHQETPLFYENEASNPEKQPESGQDNLDLQPNSKPSPQESFSEIRRKAEQLQRERDEAINTLKRIEEYALAQQQQQQKAPEPQSPSYEDDDYVEGKHLRHEINALKNELSSYRQQYQTSSIESQLRSKYTDFDKVVTADNISKLRELRPEIAQSLHQTPDLYNKAAATYTILKEMGIYQPDVYNPDKERSEHNIQKPRPTATLQRNDSPLSNAGEFRSSLSEERKKEIWAQMQRTLKY